MYGLCQEIIWWASAVRDKFAWDKQSRSRIWLDIYALSGRQFHARSKQRQIDDIANRGARREHATESGRAKLVCKRLRSIVRTDSYTWIKTCCLVLVKAGQIRNLHFVDKCVPKVAHVFGRPVIAADVLAPNQLRPSPRCGQRGILRITLPLAMPTSRALTRGRLAKRVIKRHPQRVNLTEHSPCRIQSFRFSLPAGHANRVQAKSAIRALWPHPLRANRWVVGRRERVSSRRTT